MTEDHYKPPCKGKFIVIEGIDCSGKTVQTNMLWHKLLYSIGGMRISFPNYNNETGKLISTLLQGNGKISYHGHTWACLLAANRYEDKHILEATLQHANVVANRYYISNIVYSTASGIETEWLFQLDSQMPKPNVVIVLDVPVQVSVDRKTDRDILEKDVKYLEKVRKTYIELGALMGWRVINGDRPAEYVHEEILKIVNDEFGWNL